jgi:hypothetical protein
MTEQATQPGHTTGHTTRREAHKIIAHHTPLCTTHYVMSHQGRSAWQHLPRILELGANTLHSQKQGETDKHRPAVSPHLQLGTVQHSPNCLPAMLPNHQAIKPCTEFLEAKHQQCPRYMHTPLGSTKYMAAQHSSSQARIYSTSRGMLTSAASMAQPLLAYGLHSLCAHVMKAQGHNAGLIHGHPEHRILKCTCRIIA